MKQEEPIATLINDLEAAKQQAIAVSNAFPDTIAKVVDKVGLRYQSETLNTSCDKVDFTWNYNVLMMRPYTEIVYEYNGVARIVKVHTEPFEIKLAEKIMTKVLLEPYSSALSDLKFNKHIIRSADIHIAYGILENKWDIDRATLNDKVKMFLTFS